MTEPTPSTRQMAAFAVPQNDYAIYRDGVLYSVIRGTRVDAIILLQSLFNRHPSADWDCDSGI